VIKFIADTLLQQICCRKPRACMPYYITESIHVSAYWLYLDYSIATIQNQLYTVVWYSTAL